MIVSTELFLMVVSAGHCDFVYASLSWRLLKSLNASEQEAAQMSIPPASAPLCLPQGAGARAVSDLWCVLHCASLFTVQ